MKVSAPAVAAIDAADIRNRCRADKIEADGRHDALAALPDSCQHISRILTEQFTVDTEFEIDPDNGYIEDIPQLVLRTGRRWRHKTRIPRT